LSSLTTSRTTDAPAAATYREGFQAAFLVESFAFAPLRSSTVLTTGSAAPYCRANSSEGPYPLPSLVVGIVQPATPSATPSSAETVSSRRLRDIAGSSSLSAIPASTGERTGSALDSQILPGNFMATGERGCGHDRTRKAVAVAAAPWRDTAAKAPSPLGCPSPPPPPRTTTPAAPPASPPPDTAPAASPFFFNDTATTEIYTLSLHDALP